MSQREYSRAGIISGHGGARGRGRARGRSRGTGRGAPGPECRPGHQQHSLQQPRLEQQPPNSGTPLSRPHPSQTTVPSPQVYHGSPSPAATHPKADPSKDIPLTTDRPVSTMELFPTTSLAVPHQTTPLASHSSLPNGTPSPATRLMSPTGTSPKVSPATAQKYTMAPGATQQPVSSPGKIKEELRNIHGKIQPPNRPGPGTAGGRVMVRANFFPIVLPREMTIHHYDVSIEPQKLSKNVYRKVKL